MQPFKMKGSTGNPPRPSVKKKRTAQSLEWAEAPNTHPDKVTATCVRSNAAKVCHGQVRRYELPRLHAINFVLTQVLDGGPMRSLRLDPQGKALGDALLLMLLDNDFIEATERKQI